LRQVLRELALLWLAVMLASGPRWHRPMGGFSGNRHARERVVAALGGTYHQLTDENIPAALLVFAHVEGATQPVLGATRRSRLSALLP
jgi:K+-sensing histidine kinase KdpD